MEERVYLINLYDYYGELLTEKQQLYFEDYYFNNLTFEEIGENYKISRNAIFKQVKEVIDSLNFYEAKLKLYNKGLAMKELTEKIEDQKIKEAINNLI